MDSRQIRAALAVAEHGSITSAAAELFMSAQGLKKTIDILEQEELGCSLFVRTNKGVSLTPAGEVFCAEAPSLLSHIQGFAKKVRETKSGRLVIAFWSNKQVPILDNICSEYSRRYPDDLIEFVPANNQRVIEDIEDGVADISFQAAETGIVDRDRLSYSHSGIMMGFSCVFSENHPLASKSRLDIGDLVPYTIGVVGRMGEGSLSRISNHLGIPLRDTIPHERYQIMNHCRDGGICICDEYLAQTLSGLSSRYLRWVEPVEILIAHRHLASPQVDRFILVAQELTNGS